MEASVNSFDLGQTGLLSIKQNCEAFFELLKLLSPDSDVKVQCFSLTKLSIFFVEWVKTDLFTIWIENTFRFVHLSFPNGTLTKLKTSASNTTN